jgi:hypothetical protein
MLILCLVFVITDKYAVAGTIVRLPWSISHFIKGVGDNKLCGIPDYFFVVLYYYF